MTAAARTLANPILGAASGEPPLDPIVRALCEAHCARQAFPAGHTFAMTNPIQNGRMVTLGTCACGDSFSYAYGSYERMDAAIEAHLQKFDRLPEMVDGRGQPITQDEYLAGITAKSTDAGGQSPASGPAPDLVPSSGAGDIQAAQICASKDYDALPPDVRAQAEADGTEDLLKAAIALAWKEPEIA